MHILERKALCVLIPILKSPTEITFAQQHILQTGDEKLTPTALRSTTVY